MQIVFVFDVAVDVWLEAGGQVETPRPSSCPSCGHVKVNFDGWYRRHTRRGRVSIRRVLCINEGCGQRSHSLLPDVLVSGRVDLASVIGWALEARASGLGHRPIAERLRVPAATVRGWLRRATVTSSLVPSARTPTITSRHSGSRLPSASGSRTRGYTPSAHR